MNFRKACKPVRYILNNKKLRICLIILVTIITTLVFQIIWENNSPVLTEITVESPNLPESFEGFKIAHISDFHNCEIGKDNTKLIKLVEDSNPDMIAITGDLIDSRKTNVDVALDFVDKLTKIVPCYFVSGNHESRLPNDYKILLEGLQELDVIILNDGNTTIEHGDDSINIIGIEDPMFEYEQGKVLSNIIGSKLSETVPQNSGFRLLLSHRPEYFDIYTEYNIDLALTGHAHGGQFRLPFVGGIIAPGQGFFPEYDAGLYSKDNTSMIVSRGIGNSIFPFRINNRPEIIIVTLAAQ